MARQPRDDAPGAAHHVMLRGIERRSIFFDDVDREEFLRRLSRLICELGFLCFAWVLMPNHVHLLVRSGQARISLLMARLGTGYARYFNERHDRAGHLFQNRFRSRRVIDDADLVGLVLYVTRNPLEAGLAADGAELESFPWCGLGALTGQRVARPFEAVAETLALFDPDPARARHSVRVRLATPEVLESEPLLAPGAPAKALLRTPSAGFESLVDEVCAGSGFTLEELRSRSRSPHLAAARSVLVARAATEMGLTGAEIGRRLGLSKQAVSVLLGRGSPAPSQFGRLDERPRSRS